MKEAKLNLGLWITLVVLIVISSLFAENKSAFIIPTLVTISAIKFLGVGFQFMEVKHAHIFWKILLFIFTLVFSLSIIFIY